MTKKIHISKGFTLVELIVVVIIVATLATLSIPRVTAQIENVIAMEALYNLGVIRRAAANCYDFTGSYLQCGTFGDLGMDDPNLNSKRFTYNPPINTSVTFRLMATSRSVPANTIELNLTGRNTVSFVGGGKYTNLANKINSK